MGRRGHIVPEGIAEVRKYDELEALVASFVEGDIPLLVILGTPGLSKSQSLKAGIGDNDCLFIKGRKSPLSFYTDLYVHKDEPVIIDDADDLMSQQLCRSYVKALTETDTHKRLDYDTKTKILDEEGIPRHFYTSSSVCIITNSWGNDPIYGALASRAELVHFNPDWNEVYRQAATWFWDQEILDYLHARLDVLRQPDLRIVVKAWNRKKSGNKLLDWKKVIDDHCDDAPGLRLRTLLDDPKIKTMAKRQEMWCDETGESRATFYRRLEKIRSYRPTVQQPRLKVTRTLPPVVSRPDDGFVDDSDE